VKDLLTSNLLPSRLQYRISKPKVGSTRDVESFGLCGRKNHNSLGFTLIELMIVVAILGILVGIGIPNYMSYLEKAKIITAVAEIKLITTNIEAYRASNDELPADLSEVDFQDFPDPWGNPYQYVNIDVGGGASLGPNFASAKKGAKVNVFEKRQPMGWSTAKANGLYAADGIFRKRFVESVRETIKKEQFERTAKGYIVTSGGYGGNKSLLKSYSPAHHKNIMLVGSPLMEDGLLLAKKEEEPKEAKGKEDKNGSQLNFDFDLYSLGKDGKTNKEIAHKHSEDDVIRGDNGSFIGPVSKY
jgi:prepilin-type N-terminal cleavage/methylation domain-containing protein